jgi:hypothetical protein
MLSSVTLYGHAIYPRMPCLASGGAAENLEENMDKDWFPRHFGSAHAAGAFVYIVI